MTYKISTVGKIISFKWILLFSFTLGPLLFKALSAGTPKGDALVVFYIFIWLLFCFPQLYLIFQYSKVTNYQSVEINYYQKFISISKGDKQVERHFSDIRRIIFYRPHAPIYWGSLWLTLCTDFYYYKIDFDDESYYLTSLLFPHPILNGEKYFYDSYIEVRTVYANIK